MSDGFYRAFEERYYAPREVIKALRMQYLPFVQPIADLYPEAAAFDAGCGRGEWLELMGDLGLSPFGVDIDEGMLAACVELDLPASKGDAINYIATLPDSSQVVVSAFHVVEHIAFEQLQTLVAESLRVLKPGGLLIMETPNPENIVVASCNFYLDPTHQRPIPPKLLAFVAEYAGFARVKSLRLQESKELFSRVDISLQNVISGASPDYAVIAQKQASDNILELTSDPFEADYGLSLEDLLGRWDRRFDRLESKAQEAESKAQEAESKAQEALALAEHAEAMADQYKLQLELALASTSWQFINLLTSPMNHMHKLLKLRDQAKLKQLSKTILFQLTRLIRDHPPIKRTVKRLASLLGLTARLKHMYWAAQVGPVGFHHNLSDAPHDLKQLNPRAHQIYNELKTAIKYRQDAKR